MGGADSVSAPHSWRSAWRPAVSPSSHQSHSTHTAGPGAARNLCSPLCPPDTFSLSASSGKMAWELRRLMQFTTTVCTADSSA